MVRGTIDHRVKCVVSQVPTISGPSAAMRGLWPDLVPGLLSAFDAERQGRYSGGTPKLVPVVVEDESTICASPGKEAWDFFSGSSEHAGSAEVNPVAGGHFGPYIDPIRRG